jgi:hypothetical protein
MLEMADGGSEGPGELFRAAGKEDAAPGRVALQHHQALLPGERLDPGQVFRIRPEIPGVAFAGQVAAAGGRRVLEESLAGQGFQRHAPAHPDGDFEPLAAGDLPGAAVTGEAWATLAAGEVLAVGRGQGGLLQDESPHRALGPGPMQYPNFRLSN